MFSFSLPSFIFISEPEVCFSWGQRLCLLLVQRFLIFRPRSQCPVLAGCCGGRLSWPVGRPHGLGPVHEESLGWCILVACPWCCILLRTFCWRDAFCSLSSRMLAVCGRQLDIRLSHAFQPSSPSTRRECPGTSLRHACSRLPLVLPRRPPCRPSRPRSSSRTARWAAAPSAACPSSAPAAVEWRPTATSSGPPTNASTRCGPRCCPSCRRSRRQQGHRSTGQQRGQRPQDGRRQGQQRLAGLPPGRLSAHWAAPRPRARSHPEALNLLSCCMDILAQLYFDSLKSLSTEPLYLYSPGTHIQTHTSPNTLSTPFSSTVHQESGRATADGAAQFAASMALPQHGDIGCVHSGCSGLSLSVQFVALLVPGLWLVAFAVGAVNVVAVIGPNLRVWGV